jgi:hypothetical protein
MSGCCDGGSRRGLPGPTNYGDIPSRAEAERWDAEDKAARVLHPAQFKNKSDEPVYETGDPF